jgi:hypothetical protein
MAACGDAATDLDSATDVQDGLLSVDNQTISVDRNGQVEITLTATGAEGPDFSIVVGPSHGDLEGDGAVFTYTPERAFLGRDAFSFEATSGTATSGLGVVSVDVVGFENTVPVPDEATYKTIEEIPIEIVLSATDAEGDDLTYEIYKEPYHGVVSGVPPQVTYTPVEDYAGADVFFFTVWDGDLQSGAGEISIQVQNVNDAPTAKDNEYMTDEDTPIEVSFGGTDPDGDSLSAELVQEPSHGMIMTNPFTYQPEENWHGTDTVDFEVTDPSGEYDVGTVTIRVASVEDPPRALSESYGVTEDTPREFPLKAEDGDGDALTIIIVTPPAHGVYDVVEGVYTPDPDYVGLDSLEFQASDGLYDSNTAMVSLDVLPVNDPPTALVIGISPTTPVVGVDDLVCVIEEAGADVDGDVIEYIFEWTVNGLDFVTAETTTYVGDTVPGAEVGTSQNWVCTVTTDDGLEMVSTTATLSVP